MTANQAIQSVRMILPDKPGDQIDAIVSVFSRQLQQRCPAKVVTREPAGLNVTIMIEPAIGKEGFRK